MSIGRVFHNEAAAVSIKRLLYFTEISCLPGQSRFSKFCMYSGVSPCKDLKAGSYYFKLTKSYHFL